MHPSEAIALAVECSADKILMDEKEARQVARAFRECYN
jgi:predicted nucleic acid-binding protein